MEALYRRTRCTCQGTALLGSISAYRLCEPHASLFMTAAEKVEFPFDFTGLLWTVGLPTLVLLVGLRFS